MKKLHRILSIASAAVLSAAAVAMFTACDSAEPEIVITYNFLGEDYEVEYTLSRKGAPQTVQHFIELADAGYYDGTCIHHYVDSAFLYGGAYVWDEETESIVEKDYYSEVKNLNLTQTVYTLGENGKRGDPLYTVRGEFEANGVEGNTKTLSHTQGALAMFYTGKGNSSVRVGSIRSDGGDYQEGDYYKYNCATSTPSRAQARGPNSTSTTPCSAERPISARCRICSTPSRTTSIRSGAPMPLSTAAVTTSTSTTLTTP